MKIDALVSLLAVAAIGVVAFFIFPRPNADSPVIPEFSANNKSILGENDTAPILLDSNSPTIVIEEFLRFLLESASASPENSDVSAAHALLSPQIQQTTTTANPQFAQTILDYLNLSFMPQDAQVIHSQQLSELTTAVNVEFSYSDSTKTTRTITLERIEDSWVITSFSQQ